MEVYTRLGEEKERERQRGAKKKGSEIAPSRSFVIPRSSSAEDSSPCLTFRSFKSAKNNIFRARTKDRRKKTAKRKRAAERESTQLAKGRLLPQRPLHEDKFYNIPRALKGDLISRACRKIFSEIIFSSRLTRAHFAARGSKMSLQMQNCFSLVLF